jgi:uncharacterized protein DUF6249
MTLIFEGNVPSIAHEMAVTGDSTGRNIPTRISVSFIGQRNQPGERRRGWRGRTTMEGLTGLAAVVMFLAMPTAIVGIYFWYRVRKLRTEEHLAAIQRGVAVPIEPDLSQAASSRRAGILLVAGAVGYMVAFTIVARVEPDAQIAAAFGAIPFTLGLGYFLDSALIRRDTRASA